MPDFYKYICLNILLILLSFHCGNAQVDSLTNVLSKTEDDAEKLSVIHEVIRFYHTRDCDSVFYYGDQFLEIPSYKESELSLNVIISRLNCLITVENGSALLEEVTFLEQLNYPELDETRKNLLIWRFKYMAYDALDSIQLSLDALEQQLYYAVESENDRNIANVYSGFMETYKQYFGENGLETSLEYAKKAYHLLKRSVEKKSSTIDTINLIGYGFNLAIAFQDLGKIDSAAYYHQKTLKLQKLCPELNSYSWIAMMKSRYSELLMKQGKKDEALKYLEETLLHLDENGDNPNIMSILIQTAMIYRELGVDAKVNTIVDEIRKIHKPFEDKTVDEEVYEFLAKIERDQNPKQALIYLERHIAARDSTQKEANVLSIARIEAKFQYESDRQQLAFEQSLKEAQIKQQRLLIALGAFLVSLISIIAFLIYRNNQFQRTVNKQLIETQERLQQSNRRLSRFVRSVSHDVIGKLEYILLASNGIEASNFNTKASKDYFSRSVNSATWLKSYCRELLIWSDKEPAKTPEPQTEIKGIVNSILETYNSILDKHSFEVSIGKLPTVCMDKAPLQQVLQNLIDNAIKYSKEQVKPKIHLAAVLDGEDWIIMVKDNGRGIAEQDKAMIFEETTDVTQEHGRGLSYIKDLLLEHEETIWDDNNEWNGASFYFTIR